MEPRILFDRVWKKFHRGEVHDSLRDLIPALARRLAGKVQKADELHSGDFWAVRDLSFEVVPGHTLGIIGPNGSGKSTTLKLLTRIMEPTRGYSEIRGRLGSLLEVSAGFHGDLTGRENVFLQGAIMGMKAGDIEKKFDEIVEFSGVADAIDTPVKRYSSGMNARLGFSIAAHLEPDILIIDEVLAVGDMTFQERAYGRIRDLARSGIPVVIVSHQLDRVAELCTDVILLERGEAAERGTAADTIAAYVGRSGISRKVESTGVVDFESVAFTGADAVQSGDRISVQIEGRIANQLSVSLEPLRIGVRSMRTGTNVYMTGSRQLGLTLEEPGPFKVRLGLQANLPPGSFMLEILAVDLMTGKELSSAPPIAFRVVDSTTFNGSVQLNASLERA